MDRVARLQAMPIFGAVDTAAIAWLLDGADLPALKRGAVVFDEGQRDASVYVVEAGRFSVWRRWEGRDYRLRDLAVGDCFGEMALIDCQPRSASVVAETDGRLIRIMSARLAALYERDATQYTLIVLNLARELCRRLREADTRLFAVDIDPRRSGDRVTR
jgi:CRP-like cAMP-binding protein